MNMPLSNHLESAYGDTLLPFSEHTEGLSESTIENSILCVDDEVNILQALKRLLRKEGYTIFTATCGEEALQVLANNPGIQIVMSDQRMPGMRGAELLMQVKNKYPDALRVMLSGYAEASAVVEAVNDGEIYQFLPKPWNDEEMKAAIRQCFVHYQLRHQNRQMASKIKSQNNELQRLNNLLMNMVDSQAEYLKFSQEVLDNLPIPILGLSEDAEVVLMNAAARKSSSLQGVYLGDSILEVCQAPLLSAIKKALIDTEIIRQTEVWHHNELTLPVHVTSIRTSSGASGCVMLLEEWMT